MAGYNERGMFSGMTSPTSGRSASTGYDEVSMFSEMSSAMSATSHSLQQDTGHTLQNLERDHCHLTVEQQPRHAKLCLGPDNTRKPIDPPPVIRLRVSGEGGKNDSYMISPHLFVVCSLIEDAEKPTTANLSNALVGRATSVIHRLKDTSDQYNGYFIFPDLSSKVEGSFRLQFDLFQQQGEACVHLAAVTSTAFEVHKKKAYKGLDISTPLTQTLIKQGVKMKATRSPASRLRPNGPASDNYVPQQYKKQRIGEPEPEYPVASMTKTDSAEDEQQQTQYRDYTQHISSQQAISQPISSRTTFSQHVTSQQFSSPYISPSYTTSPQIIPSYTTSPQISSQYVNSQQTGQYQMSSEYANQQNINAQFTSGHPFNPQHFTSQFQYPYNRPYGP